MKQAMRVTTVVWVMAGVVALGAQSRAGAPQPISDALRAQWDSAKKNIHDSAVDVPEAIYGFKPVDTVRTFGQVVAHTAGANYEFCSAAKGEKSPQAENAFESLATKAAIVKAYDDSVAYCDGVFKAVTDKTATDVITMPFGMGKAPRISALMGNVGHLNEHYGNLVTYMRLKGIVPPTSRK
jgi:uncharacterized damage-inducible protein DinB